MSNRAPVSAVVLAALLSAALPVDASTRWGWDEQVSHLARMPRQLQLQAVTDWVHLRLRVVYDGPEDTWQSPLESLERGAGDCEDFAFAKYALLRQLGWSAPQVRLAYGYTTALGARAAHMVVLVDSEEPGDPLVLDNLGDLPVQLSMRKDLSVLFTFSEDRLWVGTSTDIAGPIRRLKRWMTLVERMRVEGSLPDK